MRTLLPILWLILHISLFGQNVVPLRYEHDTAFSAVLKEAVAASGIEENYDVGEDGTEQISLAVAVFKDGNIIFGGVNPDNFIYPASVYKMYIAAEVLNLISQGKLELTTPYVCAMPNMVDKTREIKFDPRPLLKPGDTVTVNYLLDLMITRSDNSAANCLIDIAGRAGINEMIRQYGWQGSEVTRKFLSRKFEDPGYEKIRGTETNARHACEFLLRIQTNTLCNPWVSRQMKILLGRQLDRSKLAQGLPRDAVFYNKTGWYSYWTNDVGIVEGPDYTYIVACFIPENEASVLPKYKTLAGKIHVAVVLLLMKQ